MARAFQVSVNAGLYSPRALKLRLFQQLTRGGEVGVSLCQFDICFLCSLRRAFYEVRKPFVGIGEVGAEPLDLGYRFSHDALGHHGGGIVGVGFESVEDVSQSTSLPRARLMRS